MNDFEEEKIGGASPQADPHWDNQDNSGQENQMDVQPKNSKNNLSITDNKDSTSVEFRTALEELPPGIIGEVDQKKEQEY